MQKPSLDMIKSVKKRPITSRIIEYLMTDAANNYKLLNRQLLTFIFDKPWFDGEMNTFSHVIERLYADRLTGVFDKNSFDKDILDHVYEYFNNFIYHFDQLEQYQAIKVDKVFKKPNNYERNARYLFDEFQQYCEQYFRETDYTMEKRMTEHMFQFMVETLCVIAAEYHHNVDQYEDVTEEQQAVIAPFFKHVVEQLFDIPVDSVLLDNEDMQLVINFDEKTRRDSIVINLIPPLEVWVKLDHYNPPRTR